MELKTEIIDSDQMLVTGILNGDKHLYGELMRKYNRRVSRVCFAVMQNDELTEEMMQAAYVRAYERLGQFRFESSFGTWLTRIALNECFAYQNKQRKTRENTLKGENVTDSQTPYNMMVNHELRQLLEDAVNRLPEKLRMVFVLREVEGLSIAETTVCLGISETNVKVRLSRAKEMLRENLNSYYKNSELYPFHLDRCNRVIERVLERI